MNEQILATILWLLLIFALPLLLTFASVSVWADGVGHAGGQAGFHNGLVLLVFLVYSLGWLALLRVVYLPAMGYDPRLIALPGPFDGRFATLRAIEQLWRDFTGWVGRDALGAGARVAVLALLIALALVAARALGEWHGRRSRGYR
jgi:hypothetical protein